MLITLINTLHIEVVYLKINEMLIALMNTLHIEVVYLLLNTFK